LSNFLAGFASQGVLNKDPTVWLDGAKPANTQHLYPTLLRLECAHAAAFHTHPQNYICNYKKLANF